MIQQEWLSAGGRSGGGELGAIHTTRQIALPCGDAAGGMCGDEGCALRQEMGAEGGRKG